MKSHQRHKHTFEKPFECTDCDMKFTRRNQMKRHQLYKCLFQKPLEFYRGDCDNKIVEIDSVVCSQRQKHTLEKPLKCLLCYKQFVAKYARKLRLPTHTGLKLYQSEIIKGNGM